MNRDAALLCELRLVHIHDDAVQKRTLIHSRWGTTQIRGLGLIRKADPATVHPAVNLGDHTRQSELAELLAQRTKHARDDRLPAGAVRSLVRAARTAAQSVVTQFTF